MIDMKTIVNLCLLAFFVTALKAQDDVFLRFQNFENFEFDKEVFSTNDRNLLIDFGINEIINDFKRVEAVEIDFESNLYKSLNESGILGLITSNFVANDLMGLGSGIQFYYFGKLCVKFEYDSYLIGFSSNFEKNSKDKTRGKSRGIFRLQIQDNRLISILSLFYEIRDWDLGLKENTLKVSSNTYHYFTETIYSDFADSNEKYDELKNSYSLDNKGRVKDLVRIDYGD